MQGSVNGTAELKRLVLEIFWNKQNIFTQDIEITDRIYKDVFDYKVGYNVPKFAPDGHYDI